MVFNLIIYQIKICYGNKTTMKLYMIFIFLLTFVKDSYTMLQNDFYKYNPKIHVLGNHGLKGSIHAHIAPIATKIIDCVAYNGKDVRKSIHNTYPHEYSVLDLCCGTGFSTPSDFKRSVGVDISEQMINTANNIWCKNKYTKSFIVGDAESYCEEQPFDIVQIFFAFHEIPDTGRAKILLNAFKNARKSVVVMDICPTYNPSSSMLLGEPYIDNYLTNISRELQEFQEHIIIPGHVHMWKYDI